MTDPRRAKAFYFALVFDARGTMLLGLMTWTFGLAVFAAGQPTWLVVAALACNGVCVACFMVAGQVFLNSRAAGHIRAVSVVRP